MKSYFRVGGDSEREQGFVLAVARTLERHLRQTHLDFCLHRCRKRLFRCHHALSCHGRCVLCQRTDVLSERQGEFAFFARLRVLCASFRPATSRQQRAALARDTVPSGWQCRYCAQHSDWLLLGNFLRRLSEASAWSSLCGAGLGRARGVATSVPSLSLATFAHACSLF